MIKHFRVQNYGCLKDVELNLAPLTVLVGPNASGKSTILKALSPRPVAWQHRWQHAEVDIVLLEREHDDGSKANLRLQQNGGSGPYHETRSNWETLSYQLLRLSPDSLREENQVRNETTLNELGFNLTNLFYSLGRARQSKVAEQLSRLVPAIRDVDVRPTENAGRHTLLFEDRWREGLWYKPAEVSDGTILMLAFVVLQYQEPPVDLLCIEEPERGLHPYLLGEVVDLLRKLAHGELGERPIQVLLATHSAELLDRAQPEEVRFLSRSADGGVIVKEAPTDSPNWEQAYREYQESLGAAWLSGGLGGVPGGR